MQKLIFKLRLKNLNILFSICLIGWPEISSYIMKCWLTWFKIGFSSHSEVFTHMETSPLPVRGFKFWPIRGSYTCTHNHRAVRILWRAKPSMIRDLRLYGNLRGLMAFIPVAECFCNGAVSPCFNDLGISQQGIEPRPPACLVSGKDF